MKVLYLVEATIAGVRRHVQTLAIRLHQQGYAVTVACPLRRQQAYGEEEFVDELRAAGVRVMPLALQREVAPRPDAVAVAQTLHLLRSERFDLVHTHSSKAGFVGRIAARLAGVPVVHTPHSLHFLGQRNPLKRQFYLRLEQALSLLSDRVVAVSVGERALMVHSRIAAPQRVVCIPNGVDDALLRRPPQPLDRADLDVPPGVPLVGTLARLEAQKDPLLFVRAAALLLKAMPDAHFVWCGDGSLRAAALELADTLGIAGRCRFIGYRPDALAVLAALDVFWLTSAFEGLPHALLEALALARPVVVTDVVGNRDIVADNVNGLVVPPANPAALAQATLGLLARPQRAASLGQVGQTMVRTTYSTSRMLAATAQLYREVARSPLYVQELTNLEVPATVSINHQP
jgi:glycosyltransferase involved in cell wall biosynthesis